MEKRKSVFGIDVGEYCHIFYKNKVLPFTLIGIGVTYPNKKYYIHRKSVNYYDIEYVTNGKGYLLIDNKKIEIKKDDIYIIEPGLEHSYYPDAKDPFEKIWVAFISDSFDALFKSLKLNNIFVFSKHNELKKVFKELIMIGKTSNCSDDIQFELGLIINKIIYSLAQNNNIDDEKISDLAKNIKDILDSSIFNSLKISDIALKLNYSIKQIVREFEKYYNVTPYQYLLQNKIYSAKTLLTSTNISIKEIAEKLHFNNQNSFSNAFKLKVGVSPSIYRKNK